MYLKYERLTSILVWNAVEKALVTLYIAQSLNITMEYVNEFINGTAT